MGGLWVVYGFPEMQVLVGLRDLHGCLLGSSWVFMGYHGFLLGCSRVVPQLLTFGRQNALDCIRFDLKTAKVACSLIINIPRSRFDPTAPTPNELQTAQAQPIRRMASPQRPEERLGIAP